MAMGIERAAVPADVTSGPPASPRNPRILVPIHYPLRSPSIRTLERANRIAVARDARELVVFHVDLIQRRKSTRIKEIERAIAPVIPDRPVTLSVSRSFLVEEAILDEAQAGRADIIVLGRAQKEAWRRYLDRAVGNRIDIVAFLRAHSDAEIIVVE